MRVNADTNTRYTKAYFEEHNKWHMEFYLTI